MNQPAATFLERDDLFRLSFEEGLRREHQCAISISCASNGRGTDSITAFLLNGIKAMSETIAQLDLEEVVPVQDEDYEDWNEDIEEDVNAQGNIVVFSRDWTVETIATQIKQGNIDLNPQFQRRNAWTDDRRSKLIESLINGLPVPEIVLAEHPTRKRAFIVIDGKQRLLTIAGFIDPNIDYWRSARLRRLTIRGDLNGLSFEDLRKNEERADDYRQLMNADVRCTIISNYGSVDVLYDIFYRLNTGSVPLSTQELRQVLHKGPFADYLIQATNYQQPLHAVLGLKGPDKRLRDVDILLRFVGIVLFGDRYTGNLKNFLDNIMEWVTKDWERYEPEVSRTHEEMNEATLKLLFAFGKNAGRKYADGKWENRFNKVLFEVQAYYFRLISREEIEAKREIFVANFKELSSNNEEFRNSIEATTKTNERYQTRFVLFQEIVNRSFNMEIDSIPVRPA